MTSQARLSDVKDFYGLLGTLARKAGSARLFTSCSGRSGWPQRGVYLFMEDGEVRSDSGTGSRIVRVGTHALKTGSGTKLWTRLSQHRGPASTSGGNHRGSIFRLLVGTALVERDGLSFPSWGVGNNAVSEIRAAEVELERKVSETIGAMKVLWLDIGDEPGPESLRGTIERNTIALLSNYGREDIDPPGADWLGKFCSREKVRRSGLWNQNHV